MKRFKGLKRKARIWMNIDNRTYCKGVYPYETTSEKIRVRIIERNIQLGRKCTTFIEEVFE